MKNVFEDVLFSLGEKEKEQERQQKERNCQLLSKIFDSMDSLSYRTTWAQVQLISFAKFLKLVFPGIQIVARRSNFFS